MREFRARARWRNDHDDLRRRFGCLRRGTHVVCADTLSGLCRGAPWRGRRWWRPRHGRRAFLRRWRTRLCGRSALRWISLFGAKPRLRLRHRTRPRELWLHPCVAFGRPYGCRRLWTHRRWLRGRRARWRLRLCARWGQRRALRRALGRRLLARRLLATGLLGWGICLVPASIARV